MSASRRYRLLSREVATSMRGRAMEALVHPFSFREYLRHFSREPQNSPERRGAEIAYVRTAAGYARSTSWRAIRMAGKN